MTEATENTGLANSDPRPADSRARFDPERPAEPAVQILRAHEWRPVPAGCRCGWSQKKVLGRGWARLNHPNHVAEMLREAGVLNERQSIEHLVELVEEVQ